MNTKFLNNIIHIAAYYPPHLGGLERVAQDISEQLARNGHSVTVLTSDIGAKFAPRIETKTNLIIKRLWSFEFAHVAFIPGLFWQLLWIRKPTIFHLHLAQAFVPEMVWLASKLRRISYVVHFHLDVEKSGKLGFIFDLWKKWVQPVIIRDASAVITLSPDQTKLIEERYHKPTSQITFISNGVGEKFLEIGKTKLNLDYPFCHPRGRGDPVFLNLDSRFHGNDRKKCEDDRKKYENPENHKPLRLLFVGRLSIQKRPERLVEAMALIKSNVVLDIVGDGEDRTKLESLVAKLGIKNITFRGRLDGENLLDAYRNADIFVLPSDREGMPLVLLEAMATGLPIMGSDVLGIHELIEGVGILVKDPSPHNFARAIDELSNNPERLQKLSLASLEKAQQYSWKKLIEKLESVYESISCPTSVVPAPICHSLEKGNPDLERLDPRFREDDRRKGMDSNPICHSRENGNPDSIKKINL